MRVSLYVRNVFCSRGGRILKTPQSDYNVWCMQHENASFCVCQEEKAKAYKKEKQKERKRRAEDDVDFEEDDEMAAVMGFSGFGSSKKSH